MEGIHISSTIGRLGNHIITLMNAIYMARIFNYRWITLSNDFKYFPKVLDVYNKKFYQSRDDIALNGLKDISGFAIFHISHYLGESKKILDFDKYKAVYEDFFPILKANIAELQELQGNIPTDLNENTTLYTHLKFTDNLLENTHYKYNVLPVNLYVRLMIDYKFDTLAVITDNNRQNPYLVELKKQLDKHGKTLAVQSTNIWTDFYTLVNAKYMVMDMSTFTWTAHLASSKKQYVFMWPMFYTRFLAKYRQYVDIMLFNDADMIRKTNYCYYNMYNYPECGEWYATKEQLNLVLGGWNANNLKILNPNVMDLWNNARHDNTSLDNTSLDNQSSDTSQDINIAEGKHIALIGPGIMEIPPRGWGAVEILIWEYYQELKRLGWDVDIINPVNLSTNQGKMDYIVDKILTVQRSNNPYQYVHLHYDVFYPILDRLKDTVKHLALTSHYPYIDKLEKHVGDGYDKIFKFMITQDKYYNIMLSQKDIDAIRLKGACNKNIHMIRNGANESKFQFSSECEYPNRSICLGWITKRKRQAFLQKIPEVNMYFAGRPEDTDFNYKSPYYLGEWTKEDVYQNLTKYSNLVLLSSGEADPLVVKEAMMAGIGIVINETSSSQLDTSYPWLSVIPTDKEDDLEYIKEAILQNRIIANNPVAREEIREYAVANFSNKIIIGEYAEWLTKLIMPKPKILLVGTGISAIPAKGWGACEGIVWEYYNRLKSFGFPAKIINNENRDYQKMIKEINEECADIVHIMYDDRIDLVPFIKQENNKPRIIYTSHWGYLPQIKNKKSDPYYSNIFQKALLHQNKISYFVLSEEIKQVYVDFGVDSSRITVHHNGASDEFRFTEMPKYPDRTIYLAKIDYRKRQHLFHTISSLYFAGNVADARFNVNCGRYLGEWTRDQVYSNLTDYSNLALLSDGEADPLTVKEAMMAGCGLILSEHSCANLDLTKPWIEVIPENLIRDTKYIQEMIEKNRNICNNPNTRREIRQYAETHFNWKNIVWDYLKNKLNVV
jgi:hypothetical protein